MASTGLVTATSRTKALTVAYAKGSGLMGTAGGTAYSDAEKSSPSEAADETCGLQGSSSAHQYGTASQNWAWNQTYSSHATQRPAASYGTTDWHETSSSGTFRPAP